MATEPLRELFQTFLRNTPVEEDIVETCRDVNYVGRLEGAEFDFTGVEDVWEAIIDELVKIVLNENGEEIIVQIENNGELSLKNVITVLGFAMEKISDKTVQSSIIALLAARIYLLLCCLTSAHVFGIYHSSLFTRAITAYRNVYTIKQLRGDISTSSKSKKKAQPKNKTAGATTILSSTAANSSQFPADIEDDASPQLLQTMSNTLLHSLDQIYIYLQRDTIGTNNKIFSSFIDLIRSICQFDYSNATRTTAVESFQQFKRLGKFSDRCFALAHEAMKEKHNHEDLVLSMFCLPRLTFKSFESKFMKGSLPQSTIQMAEVMVKFVKERFEIGKEEYCIERDGKIIYSYKNDDDEEIVAANIGTDDENRDMIFVKRLAENICHHCLAERKDYRENSLKIAINFIKFLPPKLIQQFFFFAVNYGYLNNQRSRLIAVDLVSFLLETFDVASFPSDIPILENVDYEFGSICEAVEYDDNNFHQNNPTFKKNWERFLYFKGDETFQPRNAMLQLLVRATMDKLSAVRIRGLCAILPFIKTKEGYDEITKETKEFVAHSRSEVMKVLSEVQQHDENIDRNTPISSQATTQGTRAETPVPAHIQQAAQNAAEYLTNVSVAPFADLMLKRCNDKAPSVRRWVVPIIETLLTVESNPGYQKALLKKLQDFCRDPTISVRKDGAAAMTAIVRDEEIFKQAWLHTVLPMVNDREETVEKSCREYFFNKIVQPIIRDDGSDSLSWNLMIEIAKTSEFTRAFRRCFQQTAREKDYNRTLRQLATVLYGAVKVDSVAPSAWMLLDYLADAIEIDPMTAIVAWMNSDETSREVDPSVRIVTNPKELVSILSIILKRHKVFDDEQRDMIRDNIASRFVFLRLHETVIAEAIITFVGIVSHEATPQDITNLHQFFAEIIQKFYNELRYGADDEFEYTLEERKRRICLRLITMGQCALHSPKSVSSDMIKLLTHILSVEAPSLDENTTKILSRPGTRNGLPASQEPGELSQLQSLPFSDITGDISAASVIAMGKFLLSNDELQRDFLEKIAVVHGTSIHASVRNNVIYVLADCYLRYTAKMDTIQPAFLHGLRDRVDFVRYHCLILTTELLRSQYMKMSPLVLARLLPLLLDPESAIRDALTFETLSVIEEQFPNVYIDNFVTCMFLFNKVGYGTYKDVDRYEMPENPICFLNHDFSGPSKRKQRMELYRFMLKKFDDQKRFTLINQISKTIFGNVVEGKIPFETAEAKQLILDGFEIIECPEARLTLEEGQQDADEDADAEVAPENVQTLARATIRATFCSAFVHYIMPQLMSMARFLAQKKSPLQKEFRNCLAVIAEAYPDQLHVLFRDSVQFKTEIEAELRRRKKDARKSRMIKNRDLVNNIERAADAQAQRDAQSADKENAPPNADAEEAAVKIEPNATQIVKTEPMELEEQQQHQEEEVAANRTVDVTIQAIETAVENALIAEAEIEAEKLNDEEQNEVTVTEKTANQEETEESIGQIENEHVEEIDDDVFESLHTGIDFEPTLSSTPAISKSISSRKSFKPLPSPILEESIVAEEDELEVEEIQQPQPTPTRQSPEVQQQSAMQQSPEVQPQPSPVPQQSPMQQQSSVQESPILTTPPTRKHPSIADESIVEATPDTPKQPTPKRARLSLNRLQAIRDEEVAQNLALLRSPTLNAPVPKLSSRVGATQKKVSLTSENEKQGRLHSTPVKIDMTLNFTFGLQNISAINSSSTEQTSPRSRTSNITFRRRKTSSSNTRGPK